MDSMENEPPHREGEQAGKGAKDEFLEGMPLHDQGCPEDHAPADDTHGDAPDAEEVPRIHQRPRDRAGMAADAHLEDLVADEDDDHRKEVARVDVHETRTDLGNEAVHEYCHVAHGGEVHGQGALPLPSLLAEGGDHGRHGVGQHGEDRQPREGDDEFHRRSEHVIAEGKEQNQEDAHHYGGNGHDAYDMGEGQMKGLFRHGVTFFFCKFQGCRSMGLHGRNPLIQKDFCNQRISTREVFKTRTGASGQISPHSAARRVRTGASVW